MRDQRPKHLALKTNSETPTKLRQAEKCLSESSRRWTHLSRGPAQWQLIITSEGRRLLLILKCWPDGQAFNLTHTRRGCSDARHARSLAGAILTRALVHAPQLSWEGALAHSGAAPGGPLDGLALEAWGRCVLGSHGTETIRRRVLAGYYPRGIARAAD